MTCLNLLLKDIETRVALAEETRLALEAARDRIVAAELAAQSSRNRLSPVDKPVQESVDLGINGKHPALCGCGLTAMEHAARGL